MTTITVISGTQTIAVDPQGQSISVDAVTGSPVVIGSPATAVSVVNSGPVGPPGQGAGFNYTQSVANTVWTINHNMGYRPSVQTFTVGGLEVVGEIHHQSTNQTVVSFNEALAGFARLI
jgi:hypothetical protein